MLLEGYKVTDAAKDYITMIRESNLDKNTKKLAISIDTGIARLGLKLSYMKRHGLSSAEAEIRLINEGQLPLSNTT